MYGQTNCFVKPDGEYGVYAMKDDEYFVISERAARNFAFQEMTKEAKKYECLAKVMGSELIGTKLKAPMTSYEFVYALPLPTIKMDKGTGVVTSVPSDAPDDYMMLRDLQNKDGLRKILNVEEEWVKGFDPIPIIEIPGMGNLSAKFCCEEFKVASYKDADGLKKAKDKCYGEGFREGVMAIGMCAGQKVEDIKATVKKHMIDEGMACPYYEPESEVISRTGDNCCVALCDQWLLNYGEAEWLSKVKDHVFSSEFNTYNPKCLKEFDGVLDWLNEWGCSRTQGLGTELPWDKQFVIESLSDSTIYMAYYTVSGMLQGGVLDGTSKGPSGIAADQMSLEAWDYVFLGKDFNAEKCPGLTEDQLKPLRHEFNYWYPMDMRVSGKDLIRNHLTFSLYNHQAIWEDPKMMTRSYFCNGYLNLNN
jgi:leucyl-tRNA synthetase